MQRARRSLATAILSTALLLCSCSPRESEGVDAPGTAIGAVRTGATWRAALIQHRGDKDVEFKTSRTSPMAGTQYLKSEPRDRVYLTREGTDFGLAYTATSDTIVDFKREEDTWRWSSLARGVNCRADDEAVPDGAALVGRATFEVESFVLGFYPSDDRVTLIVFDPERPEMTAFEHLLYFPPDETYAVEARLIRLPEPEEVTILTSRSLEKTFYRYARIRFRLHGEDRQLTAFKYALTGESSKSLFIPFRDGSSGQESYGAGRFLEIDEPREEQFVMDFNRSFNPLCNYSPAYNCAIPPRENHLSVAIHAGERTYPGPAGHGG